MKKQIAEIIEQNLPAQTAGVMKEYIESIEGLRIDLTKSEEEVERLQRVEIKYRSDKAVLAGNEEEKRRLENWAEQLDSRQDELNKREDRIKIELSEMKMAGMEKNMENMQALVSKVFGHPNVTIQRQIPLDNGSYDSMGKVMESGETLQPATETRTESKS